MSGVGFVNEMPGHQEIFDPTETDEEREERARKRAEEAEKEKTERSRDTYGGLGRAFGSWTPQKARERVQGSLEKE